ncbi:hypothetical protein HMPREF1020_01056 [Clostridium sp. 7_3_54FAA]|nr:hypothetical protein HMPREF1020_01056 [Clostridium sp. 7_3_54FAA]
MKKVLIVIQDMASGGGQKSLLSFLKCMENSKMINLYQIDLIIAKPEGIFYSQIPASVHLLPTPKELLWLGTPLGNKMLIENFCIKGCIGKFKWIVENKIFQLNKELNEEQKLWHLWKNIIPQSENYYDIAISYMNGFPNYYVMDKVYAKKKVLWIHNEYQKLNYNIDFDRIYYKKCNRIVTISQQCKESFVYSFPEFKDKISILDNITIREDVINLGNDGIAGEFEKQNKLKLLSVGRLGEQKGFELAIKSAKILKERGLDFIWLILGEGPDRKKLQEQIDRGGLNENVKMIGIRSNPYVYIQECDIFVQTSRFEGKSIVLDEAKIFCKPIVVTNYPTVCDSIVDGHNGMIVEMDAYSIADGIQKLFENKMLMACLASELRTADGNENELKRYIEIMLDN